MAIRFSASYTPAPKGPPDAAAPTDDARRARLQAVHALAQRGEIEAASALAEQVLAEGIEHPLLLNLVAVKLETEGRLDEAEARLRRAVELAPREVGMLNAHGLALGRLERPREALERFEAVVASAPQFAPGHYNRAAALDALGRLSEAEAGYRRALELQPEHVPARAGLASLALRRGRHLDAKRLAEQALATEPGVFDPEMTLAAAELALGDAAAAEARVRALIEDPRRTPLERALAEGLLGDVFDAEDRPAEAFAAYEACNAARREIYAPAYAEGPSTLDAARWIAAYFEQADPAAWADGPASPPTGQEAGDHVFLVGFPRSGTTLLENVLAGHPEVATLEEQETLIDSLRLYMRDPAGLDRLAAAGPDELAQARAAYWRRVADAGVEVRGKVFVDKHPFNTLKLPLILRLFPGAKVLVARRDPRDVVLSCLRRRFRMSPSTYALLTLEGTAHLYDAAMRLAGWLESNLPAKAHVVRHEALIEDFDAEVGAVCDFLGLEWTEAMRDFARRPGERDVATPSSAQLARGLSKEGVGVWRRYAGQLALVMPVLQPWVQRFGYPG